MSDSVQQHRAAAKATVTIGVITISDTRTVETDTGGQLIIDLSQAAGHQIVDRRIVTDDRERIIDAILELSGDPEVDAIVCTGGTGVARRDVTYEAVTSIADREINGFGELFRMLSYAEIGSAAMLSRATAGAIGATAIFALPGSRNAIQLAMEKLILPEIAHIVFELGK